jgi:hypothetical protein
MLAASAYRYGRLKLKSGGRVSNFDFSTPEGRIEYLRAERAKAEADGAQRQWPRAEVVRPGDASERGDREANTSRRCAQSDRDRAINP